MIEEGWVGDSTLLTGTEDAAAARTASMRTRRGSWRRQAARTAKTRSERWGKVILAMVGKVVRGEFPGA